MINNIASMDLRPQISVAKATPSLHSMSLPPILGFKTPETKEKANIRIKKIKRGDNIIIPGEIDDDYVDIVEEKLDYPQTIQTPRNNNFFLTKNELIPPPLIKKTKFLKNCYIVDYIQSPKIGCGMGTAAIKSLAEKAMFDTKAEGRIVTFSAPIIRESSPAIFFYKLGFRFINPESNEIIKKCIKDNLPYIPAQT